MNEDILAEAARVHEEALGNDAEAARRLGIPRSTFQARLAQAEAKNLTGNTAGGPVKRGFHISKTTTLYKGEDQELQWVHEDADKLDPADIVKLTRDALDGFPVAPEINHNILCIEDLQATYVITDEHLGMYSWAQQTGQNYDLDIAERAMLGSAYRLMSQAPDAEHALIAKLGDTFHMDSPANVTVKSGNMLDVDTRYEKVLQLGVKTLVRVCDMALKKHETVTLKIVRGNHDPSTSFALSIIMAEHYRDNPRMEVDLSPAPFSAFEWGQNMLALHHGDTVKAELFPMSMAAIWPEMWGRTKFRYAYSGHLHRAKKGSPVIADEIGGVEWEIFQAVAARDQWNASMGFTSKRSMTAIMHDKLRGEVGRVRTYITGE